MILGNPAATEAVGAKLARLVRAGDVVTLSGELGAGKTSFARGLLAALGLVGDAPSPSFAIVQPYAPPDVRLPVLHVDLYRIEQQDDLVELGLDDVSGEAVLLVEWPERAGVGYWPEALALTIAHLEQGGRALTARVPPAWENRWPPT
jgi:tRNA threonylcarbamoyladenosine biosynthesis protein TsaE